MPDQMPRMPRALLRSKPLESVLAVLLIASWPGLGLAFTPAEIDAAAIVAEDVGLVSVLADDLYGGRQNNTPESLAVQAVLIAELSAFADGLDGGQVGDAAYKQPFSTTATGTNILAVIPGSDLADEYVMIGGHYDHLGSNVSGIFNGATDNAAGAAAVVAVGRAIASLPAPPRRSIILALWDAEEDGLVGSQVFANAPLVPLSSIVAYINFDILGANLLPSLRNVSFAIGSESGGATLQTTIQDALAHEPLDTTFLSRLFGQERSDHANFIDTIPTVFFGDATGPCYHTTGDDISIVDMGKLRLESRIALRVAIDLAETSSPPTLVPTGIFDNTYEDTVALLSVLDGAIVDLALFTPAQQTNLLANQAALAAIVADGPGAFDPADGNATIQAALDALAALATLQCDGFLLDTQSLPLANTGLLLPPLLTAVGACLLRRRGRSST